MSSTSPDPEMGFDLEECEIYYTAEVETEGIDESRLSISQTSSDDDPLSNEEWTVEYQTEMDADKELERTLNDRLEGNIDAARGACLLFSRLLRSRIKIYFCINTQVRWLSRIILTSCIQSISK